MQPALKRNALLVAALATVFWWAFQFAKHDPLLRNIVPFADDPYDAVSSFAAITAVLLAVVSLARSYFPRWMGRNGESIYILRVQATVPFCILVTVAEEVVAMVRHPSMWVGMRGSTLLLILLTALAGLAIATLTLVRNKGFERRRPIVQAAAVWLSTLLALALYPERLILGTPGHLLTVVLGDVLLFAPVAALVKAWLPEAMSSAGSCPVRERAAPQHIGLVIAVIIGLLTGTLAYLAEVREDSVLPSANRLIFVGSVFLGLGVSGIAIGYAFLGRLLGFVVNESPA